MCDISWLTFAHKGDILKHTVYITLYRGGATGMDNVHYAITYNTGFRPQGGQNSTHYTIYSEELGATVSTDYIQ